MPDGGFVAFSHWLRDWWGYITTFVAIGIVGGLMRGLHWIHQRLIDGTGMPSARLALVVIMSGAGVSGFAAWIAGMIAAELGYGYNVMLIAAGIAGWVGGSGLVKAERVIERRATRR